MQYSGFRGLTEHVSTTKLGVACLVLSTLNPPIHYSICDRTHLENGSSHVSSRVGAHFCEGPLLEVATSDFKNYTGRTIQADRHLQLDLLFCCIVFS